MTAAGDCELKLTVCLRTESSGGRHDGKPDSGVSKYLTAGQCCHFSPLVVWDVYTDSRSILVLVNTWRNIERSHNRSSQTWALFVRFAEFAPSARIAFSGDRPPTKPLIPQASLGPKDHPMPVPEPNSYEPLSLAVRVSLRTVQLEANCLGGDSIPAANPLFVTPITYTGPGDPCILKG